VIILDTNVVSELIRPDPEENVLAWVRQQPADLVYLTAITAAELRTGVAQLPEGRRKHVLMSMTNGLIEEDFADRILSFTSDAAVEYAEIVAGRKCQGRPIGMADAQVAAICRLYDADLGTRNVKDFDDTGVRVVDPWSAPGHLA
jgi:predicted nucleic acid-binding protein